MIYYNIFSHCFIINYLMIELCFIVKWKTPQNRLATFLKGKDNFYFLNLIFKVIYAHD